jgi:hypothetical protein
MQKIAILIFSIIIGYYVSNNVFEHYTQYSIQQKLHEELTRYKNDLKSANNILTLIDCRLYGLSQTSDANDLQLQSRMAIISKKNKELQSIVESLTELIDESLELSHLIPGAVEPLQYTVPKITESVSALREECLALKRFDD